MLVFTFIVVFLVLFFAGGQCNNLNTLPCTTSTGLLGNCIREQYCHYQHTNGNDLCGYELDGASLYCCTKNRVVFESNSFAPSTTSSNSFTTPSTTPYKSFAPLTTPYRSFAPLTTPYSIQEVTYRYSPVQTSTVSTTSVKSTTNYATAQTFKPLPIEQTTTKSEIVCQTPNGQKGTCISIQDCPRIRDMILNVNRSIEELNYLKESKCGFDNGTLVCCGVNADFFKQPEQLVIGNLTSSVLPNNCGVQAFNLTNRIFGGIDSDLEEFPWIALLEYEDQYGSKSAICGGSLISSRYVLTAAHCVVKTHPHRLVSVRLGEYDSSNSGRDCVKIRNYTICNEPEMHVPIESVHIHPLYNSTSKDRYHDIALLRLEREVYYTEYIKPICLPNVNDHLSPGERLTVAGWGLMNNDQTSTIKQKVQIPVIPRSQCSVMFEKSFVLRTLGKGQFCAGGETGKDACAGDSGNALMRVSNEATPRWYVEGVVSFGTGGCGFLDHYGVYTKVAEYLPWIYSTLVP